MDIGIEQSATISQIIQLSVAPVFLLTGVGTVLNVLTSRLARLVDRARRLEEASRRAGPEDAHELAEQLRVMALRAALMNRAITLCTLSALLVALVVVTLFLNALVAFDLFLPIATLFILAMVALIVALIAFLREVFLSIQALKIGS